jgi:membrane-associated phospholipid phosphatase
MVRLLLGACAASGCFAVDESPAPAPAPAPAASDDASEVHMGQGLLRDARDLFLLPAAWSKRDWAIAGGLTVVGLGLYAADDNIEHWTQKRRGQTTDRLAHLLKPFGREYAAVTLAGFAIAAPFVEDQRLTRTAWLGAESLIFAGVWYETLQLGSNRPRPGKGDDRDDFNLVPWTRNRGHSFPSGHTTAAFAVATIAAHEWRDVPGIAPLAYGLATGVAFSRINDDAHWASDVFVGAVIGWGMATGIERLHSKPASLTVTPIVSGTIKGLDFTWRF